MMSYLINSWQALIQMSIYLFSRGYWFYCVTIFPERKKDKWEKIDHKLITRYRCEKSKFQRARRKKKGLMNFYYLRWEAISLIFHTLGKPDVVLEDRFVDVRKKPLEIQVSDLISVVIYRDQKNGKFTCKLSKKTYRGFKHVLGNCPNSK